MLVEIGGVDILLLEVRVKDYTSLAAVVIECMTVWKHKCVLRRCHILENIIIQVHGYGFSITITIARGSLEDMINSMCPDKGLRCGRFLKPRKHGVFTT